MSIYAISDLHLSFGDNKPMDIFGVNWENHAEKIKENWIKKVKEDDLVLLPGDFSWALKIEDALPDFRFIDSLPGKKILLKGNHDLWWSTAKKIHEFFLKEKIQTIEIVFNNCYQIGEYAICGSRGWFAEKESDKAIVNREAGRLKTSIESAINKNLEPIVFMHYPPVLNGEAVEPIFSVLEQFGINKVYHGHIHGSGLNNSPKEHNGIAFKLISCDCIDFTPYLIK